MTATHMSGINKLAITFSLASLAISVPGLVSKIHDMNEYDAQMKEYALAQQEHDEWNKNPTGPTVGSYKGRGVFAEQISRDGTYILTVKCDDGRACQMPVPEGDVGTIYKPVPRVM